MTKKYYEGMFLLDSADYAADPDRSVQMLVETITGVDGEIEAHRPWQEGRLAYEIEGRRKGLHYLVMFTMDGSRMEDLRRVCRLNDKILRTLFLAHPKILYDATVAAIQPGDEHEEPQQEAAEQPPAQPTEAGAG